MPRSIESETFAANYVCRSNFHGSALKVEAVGATRIFQRSIVKRGLKYAHYYGDGDSKGFISVKDIYGKESVTKYECIGHVQKRVGARLRKLKSKNKNLSGKGKLTDSFIDRLQNYYGIAVRSSWKPIRSSAKCYCGFVSLLIKCRETDAWAVFHRKR
ncbi:uncharacterized protein TNCV_2387291 [Trichonephila clavipes]|nr:uncharacterized protein TNCV_2387291 [Trichonephila clavipes]